ncbi:MAG: hypothetical protein C5B51_23700 [Terriglobia bacterium]|nr:MAG: hypothetical protein C5B51_23700 [Terriglobia bacterium]
MRVAIRIFSLSFFAIGILLTAADKKSASSARGENQDLILNVTLYDDPALVKQLIGVDLDGHYILADVKVEPKYGKEILIDRDDFVLRTDKDGEKATSFAPSQITGSGAVIVTHGKSEGAASPGMVMAGPVVLRGGALAADTPSAAGPESAKPGQQTTSAGPENPLKKLLSDRILPEKKTDQPVSGLLYFPLEKQKRKDLELTYGGRENRITLRFK